MRLTSSSFIKMVCQRTGHTIQLTSIFLKVV